MPVDVDGRWEQDSGFPKSGSKKAFHRGMHLPPWISNYGSEKFRHGTLSHPREGGQDLATIISIPDPSEVHSTAALQRKDESRLVTEAKKGSEEAFRILSERHAQRMLRAAHRITRSREDAEDAVQDALTAAFIHLGSFDGRSAFSTWLTRIVINSALMIRRKDGKRPRVSTDDLNTAGKERLSRQLPANSPNPEQSYLEMERRVLLNRAIRALRPRVRAALEFSQLQENSLNDTARFLGISLAATKGRVFQARLALRNSAVLRTVGQTREEYAA
jgi:RNA polymerase sigma-70 factor (ECF subfamily)